MNNNALTLQEKMVKIRSEIPALVKRAYSEDVNYDFTKIDDIFRYLTPAMNNWNVNLDIVSEKATKKREDGTPSYIEFLSYCQMWLYEADLELKWINAENPEDVSSVTIHAIGTHEMPEKAKGSAWTYALKYYLLDKYCIDQGGEDPDMRDFPSDTYDYNADGSDGEQPDDAECPNEDTNQDDTTGAEGYEQDVTAKADPQEMDFETAGENSTEKEEASPRPKPSRHIMPESGKMVTLPNGMGQEPAVNMSVEEAENVICTFGIYKNQRLGDIMEKGDEGIQVLKWIAYDYRGKNETIRQAAKVLLNVRQAA